MAVDTGRPPLLLRWCRLALVAAGVLMVVETLLHPSRETATTIVASEPRLVAAHVVYTLAWLLLLSCWCCSAGSMWPSAAGWDVSRS
jgi:hypothetical protein